MSRPVTATIWVGNIPFDTTEAEVHALLSTVGQIKNFRLIMDRDTGKPKGFGFCEFHSKDDAESAYRNLNNTLFKGRQIRIDYAEENMSDRMNKGGGGGGGGFKDRGGERDGPGRPDREPGGPPATPWPPPPPIGLAAAQQSAAQVSSLLGGAPSGDRRIQDMLNDLLATKSRAELWEVMRMLKDFLGGDKNVAKAFFAERPGLTKAVFQAQVLLGMVKPLAPGFAPAPPGFPEGPISIGARMGGPPPPPPRPAAGGPLGLQALPPGAVPPPQGPMTQVVIVDPVTGQPQTVMVPASQLGALGTVQGPPGQPGIVQPGGPISLPGQPEGIITLQQQPQVQQPVPLAAAPQVQQPPPMQQQQQPAPAPAPAQVQQPQPAQPQPAAAPGGGVAGGMFAGQDPQQMQALLRQVAGMTDDQINVLPEQFKQQVLYVKEQIRLGHVRLE